MGNSENEQMYKRAFQPADWVSAGAAEDALFQYAGLYKKITENNRKNGEYSDYEYDVILYKAIEILCTDPELKKFWKFKKDSDDSTVMSIFYGIFAGYKRHPQITETEKNERLKKIDDKLEEIINLLKSDTSVYQSVFHGLYNFTSGLIKECQTLNSELPKENIKYPATAFQPHLFFPKLKKEIAEVKNNTHGNYPRQIKDPVISERVYLINRISDLVRFAYSNKRYNHALTAKILNKIRPDLGNFSKESVKQIVSPTQKENASKKR